MISNIKLTQKTLNIFIDIYTKPLEYFNVRLPNLVEQSIQAHNFVTFISSKYTIASRKNNHNPLSNQTPIFSNQEAYKKVKNIQNTY